MGNLSHQLERAFSWIEQVWSEGRTMDNRADSGEFATVLTLDAYCLGARCSSSQGCFKCLPVFLAQLSLKPKVAFV